MRKALVFLLLSLLAVGLFAVKNVIFLIGDGMGLAHITLTSYFVGKPLEMMKMPYSGLMYTYSANSFVTDSAAAGTALATGYKTFNGMICMTPDGKPVMTLFEAAKKVGKATGVVTTTRVTHATPAAFYAHVKNRDEEKEIARQLVEGTTIDVAFGGGMKHFSEELLEKAKANGFTVVTTREELLNLDPSAVKRVLGIFARSHLSYYVDGEDRPSLAEMTRKAIEILSKNE
ncbi:MAG: alkaline phosphatase, partial [Thermotoga sp.]